MVNITIEYQPFFFLKYTRKIEGVFPSTYEELKPVQLIAISRLANEQISDTEFLKFMTGIPESTIKKLEGYYIYRLFQLFYPFTNIAPHDRFIIPHIKTTAKGIVSPKPRLHGMTFAQFIFIENYFENYQADKNPPYLHKFIASLYLPENHAFNEDDIAASAAMVAKVKPEIIDAIVTNYVLIKEWLTLAYPMVFHRTQENEDTETPKKLKNNNTNSGWLKIFESIVGDDLVNHDRYSIIPLHNVLRWMTTKIKENMKNR